MKAKNENYLSYTNDKLQILNDAVPDEYKEYHPLDICVMIYQSLLNIYVNNPDRDGDEPPIPESPAKILASRCTKFESSDIKICISTPTEQQKQEQYSRSDATI